MDGEKMTEGTEKMVEIKFSETKAANKGLIINKKTGKPRKTKGGNGVALEHIVGVSITTEMAKFIASKCLELGINKAEYIRRLINEEMKNSNLTTV